MPLGPDSPISITITMITRSDCPSCRALLNELAPLREMSYILIRVVDVEREKLPHYAQGSIVPATYIGENLWRFGKYPRKALEERLRREIHIPDVE